MEVGGGYTNSTHHCHLPQRSHVYYQIIRHTYTHTCIHTPFHQSMYNSRLTLHPNTQNPESRTLLPGIAFGDFLRRFKEPTMEEGFQDIIRVEFRFRGDETAKRLWGQYWV